MTPSRENWFLFGAPAALIIFFIQQLKDEGLCTIKHSIYAQYCTRTVTTVPLLIVVTEVTWPVRSVTLHHSARGKQLSFRGL